MSSLFLGSYIALWLLVLVLSATVVALARQIALLHGRILPAGAKINQAGPAIGKAVPTFHGEDIDHNPVHVPSLKKKDTLLVFLSEGCSVCELLAPAVSSIARHERARMDVVLASFNGDAASNRVYARKIGLGKLRFVVSRELAYGLGVFNAPYALLIDKEGILLTKGMVNSREHLESLLNAADLGISSREEYFQRTYEVPDGGELLETRSTNGNASRG